MANGYARFLKADLHMQTPVDRAHWRGERLTAEPEPDELRAVAEAYIARCVDLELELVGITEHNFAPAPDRSLIPYLQRAARAVHDERGIEVTIFPGFEVTAPIGSGAHMICLFEPNTSMADVDAKLTALGLPPNARFGENGIPLPVPVADFTFKRILEIIQQDSAIPGMCFGAHPNDDGVLDRATVEQWWSQEIIKDENFLAIELPHARHEFLAEPRSSLIKSILSNSDPRYGRLHPIASICCSDAKKLAPENDSDTNFIGFRHTWLKMSEPTIEGIRQAFLDHESRIRFGNRPEESYMHGRIRRIRITGAPFIADQELLLSPNMNILIGGGGTGKSTIIEYLRRTLGHDREIYGSDARANFEKIMRSMRPATAVEVDVQREAETWSLQSIGGARGDIVAGEDVPNFEKFFPVRFFSQREIYAIAESREARAELVDNLIRSELDDLGRRASDVSRQIEEVGHRIEEREDLQKRLGDLQTERRDFLGKLTNLKRLDEPLALWRGFIAEREYLERIETVRDGVLVKLREQLAALEETSKDLDEVPQEWPNAAIFSELRERAKGSLGTVKDAQEAALSFFEGDMSDALAAPALDEWRSRLAEAERAYHELRAELLEQGTDPDEYLAYEKAARERDVEIGEVEERLRELEGLPERRLQHLDQLRDLWRAETTARVRKAAELEAAVPKTRADTPYVTVEVQPYGDDAAFHEQMSVFLKDRRRISDDDWRTLLEKVIEQTAEDVSPVDTFAAWMGELEQGRQPQGFPWPLSDRRTPVLTEWCTSRACDQITLLRVPDRITIALFRDDGTYAGELEEGLSVGQKSTAILTLLLADDDAPAVIDQPEDELDNEFTYRELVPLLRSVKERRQLVIATHDPNIPVNGDAELIYALEARDGRGVLKEEDGRPAAGALDRRAVRLAVETIMEGSEEAFRRRFEKYGF